MVAVNAITIDQLNYYYYVLSYSFNWMIIITCYPTRSIFSLLFLSLSLSRCAFSREVFAVAVASAIQLMHYCLFFSPLGTPSAARCDSFRWECCVLSLSALSFSLSARSLGAVSANWCIIVDCCFPALSLSALSLSPRASLSPRLSLSARLCLALSLSLSAPSVRDRRRCRCCRRRHRSVVVVKIMVGRWLEDDGDVRMTMWRVAKIIFVSLVQSYGFQPVHMSTFCIFFVIFLWMFTKSRRRLFVNIHKKITKSQKNHNLSTYVGNTWMWIHKFVSAERYGNAPLGRSLQLTETKTSTDRRTLVCRFCTSERSLREF